MQHAPKRGLFYFIFSVLLKGGGGEGGNLGVWILKGKKKNPPAFLGDWEPAGKFLLTRNLNPKPGLSNDKGLQRRWRWIDSQPTWLGSDGEAVIGDHGQAAARRGERAGLATNLAKGRKKSFVAMNVFFFVFIVIN